MCGIAGIVGDEANIHFGTIRRMCQTIVHRGPDDEGIYVRNSVGLGMRRLSIIDVAGGHQPVHNEDRSVWVVFNGEIYNFPELRPELEKRGHRFYTRTDTEVIVHLYEDYGADCVQKLRGMFAFAIYDEKKRSLLLARDRLGQKPLHYALSRGRLLFGSEMKAILAADPELAVIDTTALMQFFCLGYIPDSRTAFVPICKLPPGHLLEYRRNSAQVRQYWDLPPYGAAYRGSEESCLEELESRLAEATRLRLISDVPLGALLSGGTDSSTIVALAARASSKPLKTFSIRFPNQDFNEADHARRVAERFHTDHHELTVCPDIGEALEKLTEGLEEPFADSSIIPTYYVSRLARQHVTVALSGDGGDEFFAGYSRYGVDLRRRFLSKFVPSQVGRWYKDWVFPRLPYGTRGRNFVFNLSLPDPDRYLDSISLLPPEVRERGLFSKDFLTVLDHCEDPFAVCRSLLDAAPAQDPLSRLMYLDTKTYLAGDILTKVDRMSMAASLEVRSPLLDHHLVEWVTGFPAHWKYQQGTPKYLLKKLAERIGVPPEVVNRQKQGFALPLKHWMRKEFKGELSRLLLEPRSVQRGYFEPKAVAKLLDEHWRCRRDHSGKLWQLLVFELWHRNFLERLPGSSSLPGSITVSTLKHTPQSSGNDSSGHMSLPAMEVQ
jgi:asparagine synthase (glutamine-hydrolysing)